MIKKEIRTDIFRTSPSNLCKQKELAGEPTRKGGAKVTKEQLGTLILDTERQMYCTAKSMLYSDQDCADAIQETIVKAFSRLHTLRNDKYAKTWLIRILINECYTILRKTSKVISLDEMCETTEIAADEKTDYSELYKAVGSLKEDLRMPVILYYIENFNIREIAQIMDITEGAVQKTRQSKRKITAGSAGK